MNAATRCTFQVFAGKQFQSRSCGNRSIRDKGRCMKHLHEMEREQGPAAALPGAKDNGSHWYVEDATTLVFNNHWENFWYGFVKTQGGGLRFVTSNDSPALVLRRVRKAVKDAR